MAFLFPSGITPTKRTIVIAFVVGIIAGFGALAFFEGLKWGTAFFMGYLLQYVYPQEGQSAAVISQWSGPQSLWLLLPIMVFGSLITGILVTRLAPEAEGHGTDAAIKAFHGEGRIRKRVPVVKAVTAVFTIATGGSAGREGPSAQISAGFGSLVADMLGLSAKERRIALTTGIGAGIGTIFKAPFGGAVLAAEVLYTRDFESDAIIPAFLASVIGYAIFGFFEGYAPIFSLGAIVWNITQIPLFILLGIVCAVFGLLYIWFFYLCRDRFTAFFKKHNLPMFLKPVSGAAIIALVVLILALISPDMKTLGLAALGPGYGFDQLMFYSMLPLAVLILLPFLKIFTTSLTLGSGGSGGVFGPGLTVGAAAGASLGVILNLFFPTYVPADTIPVFVVVGMIALFGAVSNSPIAVLIMVVEMVGSITILIPAMAAVAVSHLLTGEKTIFKEQVPTKAQSGAHRGEYDRDLLSQLTVRDAMVKKDTVIAFAPSDSPAGVRHVIAETDHTGFPVIDSGKLVGIVTNRDVQGAGKEPGECPTLRQLMTAPPVTVHPGDTLEDALSLMVGRDFDHLPVVQDGTTDVLAGFITRTDIMRAYARENHCLSCEPGKKPGA
ncbi:MAG: chloride channel protein [Methanoregula sp.]|jgi:CIC family chloride channel protein